jgi:hypothetical protein
LHRSYSAPSSLAHAIRTQFNLLTSAKSKYEGCVRMQASWNGSGNDNTPHLDRLFLPARRGSALGAYSVLSAMAARRFVSVGRWFVGSSEVVDLTGRRHDCLL